MSPKRTGRPTKYSDAIADRIVALIGMGHPVASVCGRVKISEPTFFRWQSEFREFRERLTRARVELCEELEDVVRAAWLKDGHLALRALARLKPEVWGAPKAMSVPGGPVEIRIINDLPERPQ